MSAAWMVQATLTAALLGVAALAAERVAGWLGGPRRAAWTAALTGSILLPALSLLVPGLLPDLGILPDASRGGGLDAAALHWLGGSGAAPSGAVIPTVPSSAIDLAHLLGIGWLALSLTVLCALGWTYRHLRAARVGAVATEVDGVEVIVTERLGPAVVGLLRPAIVVPRWVLEAPAEERRLILLHEREHVASRDAWLLVLAALAVAAMPWSLPLWWQHRRLRAAVETDCDARVLSRGASRRAYGQVLIRTAGGRPLLPLLSPTWGETTSQLERRIMRMTEKRPTHRLLRSAPLVALAVGLVATACDVAGRGGAPAGDLTTAPVATKSAPAADAEVDGSKGEFIMVMPARTAPSLVRLGLEALVWKAETGPAFRDGKVVPPSTYPEVGLLRTEGALWKGGVRGKDVILSVNGVDARQPELFGDAQPGSQYTVRVRRDGAEREFQVEVPGEG